MAEKKYKAVYWKQGRYVIVDVETGEILDDAQGYGYKTQQKAYAAYGYKMRDKSKDAAKKQKNLGIRKWLREHPDFVELMDQTAFEIWKGSWGPDAKFDAKLVREMLEANNYKVNFTAKQLISTWERFKH